LRSVRPSYFGQIYRNSSLLSTNSVILLALISSVQIFTLIRFSFDNIN
jgi:hypothetical protein